MKNSIKDILKRKNILVKTIASDLNIPYNTFRNYMTDRNEPDIQTVVDIMRYLNVSFEEIYNLESKSIPVEEINHDLKELIIKYTR